MKLTCSKEGGEIYGDVGGEECERELLEIGGEGVVLVSGGEEDDIKNLKISDGFKSKDVIDIKKNDIIYSDILGKAWFWKMKILVSVLIRKERVVGPRKSRFKVAEKEETGNFHDSPYGGPISPGDPKYIRGPSVI
uniref:Uncharacterized protein n=1 Tax=Tanacetum cinerariifolium TaxID=118510 RepID=A0A6L2M5Q9_TANCI|nr:hypothetical protein [Tanacetum cinerariifolium]